jgi:hypothetical protein
VQTRFLLDAMVGKDRTNQENWSRVFASFDVITNRLVAVEKAHHQLMAQVELAALVAENVAMERTELYHKVEETGKVVAQMRFEIERQLGDFTVGLEGDGENLNLHGAIPNHKGKQEKGEASGTDRRVQAEGQKDSRSSQALPKMSYPKFSSGDPVVWLDLCIDYFTIYKIPESIWVSSAAMHLEFSGAQWWKCYKLQHGMVGWQGFVAAVTSKFGANAYPRALRRLMSLRQTDSLDSYISEFEKVRYGVVVHNPKFDEIFFVTQFARGLKLEIQNVVQVQVPTTVDSSVLKASPRRLRGGLTPRRLVRLPCLGAA